MNEVIVKNFEDTKVDIIEVDGEPMFELYSVGMALGYVKSNFVKGKDYVQCRKDRVDKTVANAEITPLVHDGLTYLSESQLYDFMLEAKTEKVKPFRKWITSEVLPTIRKHGAYMSPDVIEKTLSDPDFIIQLATKLKEEQIARKLAETKIIELAPKAEFHDAIATSENCMEFGKFAGVFQNNKKKKLGRNTIMKWCRSKNYLCSSHSLWNKPSQKMLENDYMDYRENVDERNGEFCITYTPLLTGKGQIWLTKKLLEETV